MQHVNMFTTHLNILEKKRTKHNVLVRVKIEAD